MIPLEHYSELTQCWPKNAVLLIEDAGGGVESLCRLMRMHHKDLPFVAFSAEASPERRSAALLKGAGAYLPWPCSSEEMKATLLSVARGHAAPADGAGRSGFPQLAPRSPSPVEAGTVTSGDVAGLRAMRDLWRAARSAPSDTPTEGPATIARTDAPAEA
ncbi:hypothetical protein MTR62_09135 [Novosphingobium sp. 1949]|uniref:Response regulator n=1 Tax=Novosphingobium organovorum TaxID=2930092 RepID=A0ABT0BCS3_9SPHN|nr:hypothetical protein [Novosphingobium organovorum]MCJ2182854.1 hypothetical protein [Novosphingobium organovorum]